MSTATAGHDNARRTACDRCRELKLRCPRLEEESPQSCARCDRAGALCVTSKSRPLGRPRVAAPVSPASAQTSVSDERRKRPRESPSLATRHSVDRNPSWAAMDDYSSFLDAVPNAVTSMLDLPGPGDQPSRGPSEQPEQSFDIQFGDDDGFLSSLSTLHHQFSPRSINGNRAGSLDFAVGSLDMGPVRRTGCGSSANTFGEISALDRLPSQPTDAVAPVPIVSLSRLSESVSRQIACLGMYTWGGPSQLGLCVEKVNETQGNPIAQALHTTTDYNKVLERLLAQLQSASTAAHLYKSPNTDSAVSTSTPEPPSSREEYFTTPVLLLVLSVYLQLLVLHDAILDRVCQSLRELQDPTKFFQNAPEFTLSQGIPAMKGHLYLKILVQVIEHHIDHAERLIGLPAEYRLSGQPAASGMLSGNAAGMSLLQVTMTQLDCAPKRSGESIVASLKSNLKGVQQLVRN
ncbi:hypothetical protein EKO27_g3159 [Xylaria grammica]|uniref:Zn(2)-C6 fungal-type domain-containing protein n=1 Tax=Xylaria grammica TaxID=363999 RepID=A0A439DC04_9PEZI|nr:hypothetical protein EKO27_g3159 [Xylaria grammica]